MTRKKLGANKELPVKVILDTNVIKSDPFLRGPSFQSLLYSIGRKRGHLVLTDPLEYELRKHVKKDVTDILARQDKDDRYLTGIFGCQQPRTPLSGSKIDEMITARLAAFRMLERLVATQVQISRAAWRVISEKPPNHTKAGQIVDSITWEMISDLADEAHVILISADNDFRLAQGNDSLHPELAAEVQGKSGSVTLFRDVQTCLSKLEADLKAPTFEAFDSLDYYLKAIILSHLDAHLESLRAPDKGGMIIRMLQFKNVEVSEEEANDIRLREASKHTTFLFEGERVTRSLRLYPTGDPNKETVAFDIDYPLQSKGYARVKGTCGYDVKQKSLGGIRIDQIQFVDVESPEGKINGFSGHPNLFASDIAQLQARDAELFSTNHVDRTHYIGQIQAR